MRPRLVIYSYSAYGSHRDLLSVYSFSVLGFVSRSESSHGLSEEHDNLRQG